MRLWTLFATFLINFVLLLTACSSEDKNAGGTSEAENSIAIIDKQVAGVSQKGPFTKGSTVTLYELNFRTRAQTGKSFLGKISDSTGSFSINKIELASQYALLRADGYYRNEITGKISASQITLNAISDLSERDNVNINLLTHLEYDRAVWLAQENEITIKNAKVELTSLEGGHRVQTVIDKRDVQIVHFQERTQHRAEIHIVLNQKNLLL